MKKTQKLLLKNYKNKVEIIIREEKEEKITFFFHKNIYKEKNYIKFITNYFI